MKNFNIFFFLLSKSTIKTICFLWLVFSSINIVKSMDLSDLQEEAQEHKPSFTHLTPISIDNDIDNSWEEGSRKNANIDEDIALISLYPTSVVQSDDSNPFVPYIYHYIINDESIKQNPWAYRGRLGIKGLSLLYGLTAGLPYISSSCKAGRGNMFLCTAYATGNVISYGGAAAWAALRLTNSLDPVSEEEISILYPVTSCSVFRHIACNVLGMMASIPGTYVAYNYNTGSLKYLAIPGFITSYLFSTLGYYEATNPASILWSSISSLMKRDRTSKVSDKIKENIIEHIENHVIPSILENDEIRDRLFAKEIKEGDKAAAVKQFLEELLSLNCHSNAAAPHPKAWKNGYPRKFVQATSILLPIGGAIVSYLITNKTVNLLTGSPIFSTCFSTVAIVPNFALDVLSTSRTLGNVFDGAYNMAKGRNISNFTSSYYPATPFLIPVVSVTLACLSVAGAWFISYDTIIDSELKSLAYVLPTIVFILNVIFESFGNRDLFHDTVKYFSTFRKDSQGETANTVGRLEKFTDTISNSKPAILHDFWNGSNISSEEMEHGLMDQ